MIKPADRLAHFSEYYFSAKLRELKQLELQGRSIINLGIGSPDRMPDTQVIQALSLAAGQVDAHGYQPYQGLPELREAIKSFYANQYHQEVDGLQVLPLMGSKEGITHISMAYLNPGDQVLIPELGYPTYASVTKMIGAVPVHYRLDERKQWQPDWEALEAIDLSKTKLMWINYPHMPTGARGDLNLFSRFVDFAKAKGLLLCHDNPYSFIGNDEPLSIFNVEGAAEVAIELGSLSKTYNMAGWRVGWAIGADSLIQPVVQIKSNMDSGMFKPIQQAAICALQLGNDWFESINQVYARRRDQAHKIFDLLGCSYADDQAGMFVWAKVPHGSGETFTEQLLAEHDVFMAPGFIFGVQAGHQFIRMSLCASEATFQTVLKRLK